MLVYMCHFILTKVFIINGCEMLVRLTNITSIIASKNKLINNLWTENTWIRIFVRKCQTQFMVNASLAFLQNLLQILSLFWCHFRIHCYERSLKYLVSILGIWAGMLPVFALLIAFWTLSIMLRGYWFLSRTCLKFFRSISTLVQVLLILYIRSINLLINLCL